MGTPSGARIRGWRNSERADQSRQFRLVDQRRGIGRRHPGALAFFGALLLAVIAFAGWSSNQTAFERERTLVENALNQSIAGALNEQKSVAWWDDAVLKITDQKIDLDFTDANFGVFLTETYSQDEVYILNGQDKPIYAFANSERRAPSTFEQLRPALKRVIAEARKAADLVRKAVGQ